MIKQLWFWTSSQRFFILIIALLAIVAVTLGLPGTLGAGPSPTLEPSVFSTDDHVLTSEAVVTPTASEFIEIANPTGAAIALADYYLSDDADYALLPGAFGTGPAPSISSSDFIVQFPPGASIPAGGVRVVAFDGAGFLAAFGSAADFEIKATDAGTPDMIATDVGGSAGLTNSGENVVLFVWDGASDLVADVDMVNIGTPSVANAIGDKSGVTVDGPDADVIASTYLPDAFTMPLQTGDPGFGASTKRILLEAGSETTGGGNGITGDDETSESITTTWDSPPFSAPDPGVAAIFPPPEIVITEIMQNPAAVSDTNGEWFEVFNPTGSAIDIDGWTIRDDGSNSHTISKGGPLLVPAGGFLVLARNDNSLTNGGVTVDYEYAGFFLGNGDDEVVLLDTDLNEIDRVNYDGGPAFPDPTGATMSLIAASLDNNVGANWCTATTSFGAGDKGTPGTFNDCVLEIFSSQGSGLFSPFENSTVTTENNVVTALATNGFYIQTPTARTDGDVDTSDGIFVFTGGFPSVSVGDRVDVTGNINEFFGSTEFNNSPAITITGMGVVPATTPSPNPTVPSCSVNNFECFEGMLIEITGGSVAASNQRFATDITAEVFIVAGPDRAYREPGIEYPGLLGLPVWDGNPEVFELDPDRLGLTNLIIPGGSSFNATGVLGFEFGGYEFFPSSLNGTSAPLPVAVRARNANEFTVGSLNLFRLFDDVDDPPSTNAQDAARNDALVSTAAEYLQRRAKLVQYILDVLRAPDILAVQEAEKIEVLQDLAADIGITDPSVVYTAYLIEGNDVGTIDIGFLVRNTVQVDAITQLGLAETFIDPTDFSVDLVHDRPPLLLEGGFDTGGFLSPIAVLGVHNRSFSGIEGSQADRVRKKRLEQAQSIAQKVQDFQTTNPTVGLVVTGDFNDYEFTDGYVDAVGQISGNFTPVDNLLSGPDLVNPDLTNQVLSLPAEERYSFIFQGSAQVLDHALTSTALNPAVTGFAYGRGNADAAVDLINDDSTSLRSSDHDGLVLYLTPQTPSVGGTTTFLIDGSGSLAGGVIAVLAGTAAVAFGIIVVAGCYTRRRWMGSRP